MRSTLSAASGAAGSKSSASSARTRGEALSNAITTGSVFFRFTRSFISSFPVRSVVAQIPRRSSYAWNACPKSSPKRARAARAFGSSVASTAAPSAQAAMSAPVFFAAIAR